jgi:hypothetical protein
MDLILILQAELGPSVPQEAEAAGVYVQGADFRDLHLAENNRINFSSSRTLDKIPSTKIN